MLTTIVNFSLIAIIIVKNYINFSKQNLYLFFFKYKKWSMIDLIEFNYLIIIWFYNCNIFKVTKKQIEICLLQFHIEMTTIHFKFGILKQESSIFS